MRAFLGLFLGGRSASSSAGSMAQKQESVLILLHGLADTSSYWEPFRAALELLGPASESIKIVALEAPIRKVYGEQVPAWFQYLSDRSGQAKEDSINEEHLEETRAMLHALIREEAAKLDGSGGTSRVLLAGSSQGGSAALDAALTLAEPLAGVALLRGLPLGASIKAARQPEEGRGMTPVLAVSGEQDKTFLLTLVKKQLAGIQKLVEVTHEVIPKLDHDTSVDVSELQLFVNFVARQLGLGPADAVTPEALAKFVEELPIAEKSWADLTERERNAAKALGVHHASAWDNGTAPVWSKSWRKLTDEQKKAAARLGFTEGSWNNSG